MKLNINDIHRAATGARWLGLLAGGAIACMVALAAHVYGMSALQLSAHLLSIRLERATGCDQYQHIVDAVGQSAHSSAAAYINVCVETHGSTGLKGYLVMLGLEVIPRAVP